MGFTPLASSAPRLSQGFTPGFTPLSVGSDDDQPSALAPAIETVKDIGRVYPIAEMVGNLATQMIAMPVAGIAGLGAAATNAVGLTDTAPADVVHKVSNALTYQPHTESGSHLTGAATYPFQKLAEAGQYAGDKTLDVTGSPALATIADTAVNALPMALPVKAAEPKGVLARAADKHMGYQAEQRAKMATTEAMAADPAIVPAQRVAPVETALDATKQPDAVVPVPEDKLLPAAPANQVADAYLLPDPSENTGQLKTPPIVEVAPGAAKTGFTPLETANPNASLMQDGKVTERVTPETSISESVPAQGVDLLKKPETSEGAANAGPLPVSAGVTNFLSPPREGAAAPLTMDEHPKITLRADNKITARAAPEIVGIETAPMQGIEGVAGSSDLLTKANIPEGAAIGEIRAREEFSESTTRARESDPTPSSNAASETPPRTSGFTPLESTMPNVPVDSRAAWAPGANYTGFADNVTTASKLTDKPIRREDVLAPLMKDIGLRLYEGRVSGKRLGFYIPKLEAVRIKNKSDLEVAAHEIAHALDDRIPEIRASWLKGDMAKVHAEELRGVSYDKAKLYEGFAEFTRLYMTQPEKAKASAPNFYKWFDSFTQTHKYGAAIRNAQEGMTAWHKQDALHRAQSKIGTQRTINEALDGFGDRFRQSVSDDLHGVYRMERQLTGKTSPLGAYESARLTRGAGGLVDGAIRLGSPIRKANGSFDFQGKGLEKILEPVAGNLDEFLMYAVGRSSHELMLQGREKLFTPAEVQAMLKLKRPEFDTAFSEYQAWNKGVLDFAESMGVINKKARSMWQRSQYLPYYRAGQAGASASRGGAQGNWAGIHALTGGTGNLRDILGNMTQNAATLIDTALKNEARAKIVKLAETQRGGGNFLVKIAPDSKLVKIEREQIKDKMLETLGIDPKAARAGVLDEAQAKVAAMIDEQMEQAPGLFEFMVQGQTPKGNIMAVLEDGKPTYYEVADPLLYRAVSSLNRAPQHWIIRLLGIPKRIGQMTITLTPDFMIANIARDTIMGSVMSRAGFTPFVDSVKGMASRIKQDPAYREFLANGGGFASYLTDESTFRAHLDRFYTSKGINPKTVLDTPDKMMYFVETLADAFEMSTRLGEYKKMRKQGEHPRHAAYVSRDISTDFAMKGDSQVLGAMYDTVMFLRPAVVSMDRLYRGLAHDPNKGAIAAKAGTIALLSAWLYWHNKDNPRYQDMEDWKKDSYWHFFVPVNGKEEHFMYPKIWEVGALASVAERSVAMLNDQEPEYGKAVGRILKNLFNLNMMPQVLAPPLEQATNRNSFTGAPIETPGMDNMQPFMRAKPTTSETLKALGIATRNMPESLQVNPVRAEALLRGYFNTWAMYGLMLTDSALYSDKLPEKRADELPVVRRFYEADPAKHTKYETMYYDMLGEAKRLHGTVRELEQAGHLDMADEIDKSPLSRKYDDFERTSKDVRQINADMEEVRMSALTPAEKRAKLDALTVERNMLLKETVQEVKRGVSDSAR